MPFYEYECRACEARFERLTTMAGADEERCARCGSADTRRLLSVIAGMTGQAQAPQAGCGSGGCGNC